MRIEKITTLFLDIGGVLVTGGWGRESRLSAGKKFQLDILEMEIRHSIAFDTFEPGKLNLDEYLDIVVFHEQRRFTKDELSQFIFSQSQAACGND